MNPFTDVSTLSVVCNGWFATDDREPFLSSQNCFDSALSLTAGIPWCHDLLFGNGESGSGCEYPASVKNQFTKFASPFLS